MNSHNSADEDDVDEFLYGPSSGETEKKTNTSNYNAPLIVQQDDVKGEAESEEDEDLYELYKGSTANEAQDISRQEKEEDVMETDTKEVKEEQGENEEDYSDDDLEIMLENDESENVGDNTEASGQDGAPAAATNGSPEPATTKGGSNPLVTIKPGQQGKSSNTPQANSQSNPSASSGKTSTGGINLEAVGELNGQPITDVDLDTVEDKPWRKPGADITDFFNYGFNEVTWRAYCLKQKMLRENKKMMGDIDMSDFMSMGMMMPTSMMDGSMPMSIGSMTNSMMGMPMGMGTTVGMGTTSSSSGQGIRSGRNTNFPIRSTGRTGMSMGGRPKSSEGGNDRDGDSIMNMDDGMFPMDFQSGSSMPMNMFPSEMTGNPMGLTFFNPAMQGGPMNFDGDFRGRSPMRGGSSTIARMGLMRGGNNSTSNNNSSSSNNNNNSNSNSNSNSNNSNSNNSSSGGRNSSRDR